MDRTSDNMKQNTSNDMTHLHQLSARTAENIRMLLQQVLPWSSSQTLKARDN